MNIIKTKLGYISIIGNASGLTNIIFGKKIPDKEKINPIWVGEIKEYLNGQRKKFDIPIILNGSLFERRVWNCVKKIPYGKTVSYKKIGMQLGNKDLARSVGNALSRNPIPIIIPCHRVIKSDGSLGGFTGGIRWKKFFIEIEKGKIK